MCDQCKVRGARLLSMHSAEEQRLIVMSIESDAADEAADKARDAAIEECNTAYRKVHEQIGPIVRHLRETADRVEFVVGANAPIYKELVSILGMVGDLPPQLPT